MVHDSVRRRQAQVRTPESAVFTLVRRATAGEPIGLTRLATGYENEVYVVHMRDGAAFVVRVRHWGSVDFRHEAWAIDRCREAGVPAPAVLLVDEIPSGGLSVQAMVQEHAAGRSLRDALAVIDGPALDRVLCQAGEVLGGIHGIEVEGFGCRVGEGRWDHATWEEEMDAELAGARAKRDYVLQAGFSAREFDFMLAMLERYRDEFPCRRPVLCHGDLVPEHIFVDGDMNISAVIDWGQIHGAPPIVDFMHLSLARPELDLGAVRRGYPNKDVVGKDFDLRLHLQRLSFLLGCVAHVTKTGDPESDKTPDPSGQLRRTLQKLGYAGE
jgi:aminoglycoside phosphotransferase (APT) family kinase protein